MAEEMVIAHRLFVPGEVLAAERPELPRDVRHHLKVLRLEEGESVALFDGRGARRVYAFRSGILQAAGGIETLPPLGYALTLFACVTKGSRWDWTIEKAVELGVTRIVPVISDRTIVRLTAAERPAKRERWQRIAEEAAGQCGTAFVPEVTAIVDFPAARAAAAEACTFVGAIEPGKPPKMLLAACAEAGPERIRNAGVFVGPEGDFTPAELQDLKACCVATSFGPTILRAETAALYALSVLQGFRLQFEN